MTEDQDAKETQPDTGSKIFVNNNKYKKLKSQRPLTKIVMRRLPPTMTEESFLEQVSPIPEHDHFYFAKADPSLGNNLYSRAYINFVNVDDIYLFRDKFDGVEFVGIVEYAPFQRIPKKKKKKDPKCSTIESDPIYQEFIENLTKEPETENQPKLEYSYPIGDDKRGRDERRRRENDKRKMRIERKGKDGPIKEEDNGENDVKKIKPRDWDRDKNDRDDYDKEGSIFESKTYKERKTGSSFVSDKKRKDSDKRDYGNDDDGEDSDKGYRKDKRDKIKDSPREQKSKKYSDTRKERIKQNEVAKSDKQAAINKIMSSDVTSKINQDDIKPFTQLPHVKTDDLTKLIETLDKKTKIVEDLIETHKDSNDNVSDKPLAKVRRNSMDCSETPKEESPFKRQKSLNIDDRSRSTDTERDGSEEKDKSDSDRRTERRIRNKDRPSLVIYQPGMGKFSKQRIAKEKEAHLPTAKSVNESEKKDT
ncbi:Upf3 regulator of nonsense transcripts-like protein B [Operophtera brumata]|uniref:Upf3 regulator of nonsense transcripts-like protein B n=1 Tax=Operophtera brumata TaxID=104452 RepID=A0A0L7LPN2_OPEBR|nr:Upf3 regulator of nonsense transcripts-like protein B [Operophtera brumata]